MLKQSMQQVQLLVANPKRLLQLCLQRIQHACLNELVLSEVKLKPSLKTDTTHTREHSVDSASKRTAIQDWACQLDQHCSVIVDQI